MTNGRWKLLPWGALIARELVMGLGYRLAPFRQYLVGAQVISPGNWSLYDYTFS